MLRRFELLVNEVRESTSTEDINSIGEYEIMRYFNDGQKLIQKILFTANPSSDIFVRQAKYTITDRTQIAYDLPFDIYAHNAVNNINSLKDGNIAQTLTRVAYREKEYLWGYALQDKQFILTSNPEVSTIQALLLNYVYQLPIMGYRLAQVDSVAAQIINVVQGTVIENEDFENRYEYYTIVDKYGNVKQSADYQNQSNRLLLTGRNGSGFTFEGDLTQVVNGDWIVAGESGTSHSCLPKECEPYLLTYVQRRILNKISSQEVQSENIFTMQERMDLEDLFKDTVKDPLYPVSSDTDYLGY